eukprot:SAG31_NODE_770_length_12217_cov_2.855174_9_plen_86_part_00
MIQPARRPAGSACTGHCAGWHGARCARGSLQEAPAAAARGAGGGVLAGASSWLHCGIARVLAQPTSRLVAHVAARLLSVAGGHTG